MEREALIYQDRRGTGCSKWDGQTPSFGEEGLDPFWVADMDFHAPQAVRKALTHWAETAIFGYGGDKKAWMDSFLAWEETRHGLKAEADWLRYAPGIVTGIFWVISALTAPGDAVTVLKPVYYPFFHAVEDTGRRLVYGTLRNDGGVYTVDFDALEQLFREEKPKALLLSSPHNPVGRVFRREELERFCTLCETYGVLLLSDEIHQDLILPGHTQIPMLTLRQKNTVSFAAASKTFNLAGLQNSFLLLPDPALREKYDDFVRRVAHVSGGTEVGCIAAAAAFREGGPWLASVLDQVEENYRAIRDILAGKAPRAVVSPLEGTYLMWVDLRPYVREQDAVHDLLQKTCRLAVDYGEWFGGDDYVGFIRLNLATSRENCVRAAERLGDALHALR